MSVTAQRISVGGASKPIVLEPLRSEIKKEPAEEAVREESVYEPPVIREVRYFSHPVKAGRHKLGIGTVLVVQLIAVLVLGISVAALLSFSDSSVQSAVKDIVGEFT